MSDALRTIGVFADDLVVQAGAGTGKTHALVTLYLHLIAGLTERGEPIPVPRILVVTFTDKAAGELRERIRSRLVALIERGPEAEPTLLETAAWLDRSLPDVSVLRRAHADLGRAPIGTFHAFGQGLLRRHALAVGLDPDFAVLDDGEARARLVELASSVVLASLEARDAATEGLVDAMGFGARDGYGLVDALIQVRARRAEEGRSAKGLAAAYEQQILVEERAAAEGDLRGAFAAFATLGDSVGPGSLPRLPIIFAAAEAPELGDARATAFIAQIQAEVSLLRATKGNSEPVADVKRAHKAAVERLVDADASFVAAPWAQAMERLLGELDERYAAWKLSARAVDFTDLIRMPRDLLAARSHLAAEEGERFDALLLDEFQDTNAPQSQLIDLIAGAIDAKQRGGRRFIVGDRKQSIYEFRGADVGVFTEVTEALRRSGASEVLLRRSFRSTPSVVALCNALFERAFAVVNKGAWSLRFDPTRDALTTERPALIGPGAELLRVPLAETGKAPPADELRRREARAIAQHMRTLVAHGRRPGEIALLLRRYTNLPTYLGAMRAAGLPHYVVRGRGFYEAQEIRDLASLLSLLHDPEDRYALVAVLRSPLCGVSDEALVQLEVASELRLAAILRGPRAELAADDRAQLGELRQRITEIDRVMASLDPDQLLREIIDRFDLHAILAGTPDGIQKIANLEHLVSRAAALADQSAIAADLPSFARWIERAVRPRASLDGSGAQIVDERDDVIRVMSIHQAKGLQFPVVFVADCGSREMNVVGPVFYDPSAGFGINVPGPEPGKLISTTASRRVREIRTERQRAESLRLFYVAATRAQDRVIFSGERTSADGGWRRYLDETSNDPQTAALLTVTTAVEAAPLPAIADPATPTTELGPLRALEAFVPRHARSLRVAVTQLEDFALCARRYHLFHELGLPEPQVGERFSTARETPDPEAPVDPRRAGTLVHRLLWRCTFGLEEAAARTELRTLLSNDGYDVDDPGIHEIEDHVTRFLCTPFASSLSHDAVRRELPFALAFSAGARVLRGQIDLLVLSPDGVSVIDYKHAHAPDAAELEAYRFQLEAYALAAEALYPRAPAVRVGLCFLREPDPAPIWIDVGASAERGDKMAALLETLAQARLQGERPTIERARCVAAACGYVSVCHRVET